MSACLCVLGYVVCVCVVGKVCWLYLVTDGVRLCCGDVVSILGSKGAV